MGSSRSSKAIQVALAASVVILSIMVAMCLPVLAQESVGSSAGAASTESSLRVLSIAPEDGSTGNPANTRILVIFDRPLSKDSVHLFSFVLEEGAGPRRVFGSLDYNPEMKAVRFVPSEPLNQGAKYTFTVGKGVQGADGSKMAAEKTSSFFVGKPQAQAAAAPASASSRAAARIARRAALRASDKTVADKSADADAAVADAVAAVALSSDDSKSESTATTEGDEKSGGPWLDALEKKLDAVRLEKREQVRKARADELRKAAAESVAEVSIEPSAEPSAEPPEETLVEATASKSASDYDTSGIKPTVGATDIVALVRPDARLGTAKKAEEKSAEKVAAKVKAVEAAKAPESEWEERKPAKSREPEAAASGAMKMVSHEPASNARNIPTDTQVTMNFSGPAGQPSEWDDRVSLRKVSNGRTVACSMNSGQEEESLVLKPRSSLAVNSLYQVTVQRNSENPETVLDKTYGWLFRTGKTGSDSSKAAAEVPAAVVASAESAETAAASQDDTGASKRVSSLTSRLMGRLKTIRSLVSGRDSKEKPAEKPEDTSVASSMDSALDSIRLTDDSPAVSAKSSSRGSDSIGFMEGAASTAGSVASSAVSAVASTAASTVSAGAVTTGARAAAAVQTVASAGRTVASTVSSAVTASEEKRTPDQISDAFSKVIARARAKAEEARRDAVSVDNTVDRPVIDQDSGSDSDSDDQSVVSAGSSISSIPAMETSVARGGRGVSALSSQDSPESARGLKLLSHIPSSGEDRVTPVTPIVITFDRNIDPLSVGADSIRVTMEGAEGKVRGRFFTMRDKVYFKAERPGFQAGGHYFCQVTKGLRGKDGSVLSGDYLWDFSVDNGLSGTAVASASAKVSDKAGEIDPQKTTDSATQSQLMDEFKSQRAQESAAKAAAVSEASQVAAASAVSDAVADAATESDAASKAADLVSLARDNSPSVKASPLWDGWIRFVAPADNTTDVLTNARIQVGLPQEVEPASVNIFNISLRKGDPSTKDQEGGIQTADQLADQTSGQTDDQGRILGNIYLEMDTKSAWFSPLNPLEYGTWYILTVKDIRLKSGKTMKEKASFTFRTMDKVDSVLPRVVMTDPVRGADDVKVEANVNIRFSESLEKDSVNMFCLTVNDGTRNVFGSVVLSETTNTVTFVPREQLAHDTIYRVSVAGVRDLAGNSMEPVQWLFRTIRKPDSEGPGVMDVRPAMGEEGVSVYCAVVATMSEPIEEITVTHNSIGLWDGTAYVDGKVVYDREKSTLSFFPAVKLRESTLYNAFVSRGVRDLAGNPMGRHFTWTFVTEKAQDRSNPTISEILPTIGARNTSVLSAVRVKFSESINPSTLSWKNLGLKEEDTGREIPGDYTYDQSTWTASFVPSEKLTYATAYRAWVGTGILDLAGNPLAAGADWAFFTEEKPDTTAPQVQSVSPIVGARNVAVNSDVTATLSEALKPGSITPYTLTLTEEKGKYPVTGEITLDPLTNTLAFRPSEALKFDTVYRAVLADSLEDNAGNRLGRGFAWNFRTLTKEFASRLREFDEKGRTGALVVSQVEPADGTDGVDIATDITVTFNRSVAPSTINEDTVFLIDDMGRAVKTMMSYDDVRNTLLMRPVHDLNRNTLYTLIVAGGAVYDTFGVPMSDDFTAAFKTHREGREADRDAKGNERINPVKVAAEARAAAGARGQKDETAPMVSETSPRNGAFDVIQTPSISVTFNEAMDPLTVNEYTITLDDGQKYIPGSVIFNEPTSKALFSPKVKLAKGATYRLTVTRDVKDAAGNTLASPKVVSFTVVNPKGPRVVKISPPNGSSDNTITSDIRVSFDKQVLALTLTSFNFQVLQGVKPVRGRISYDTFTRQAIFIPDSPLEYGVDYQVRLLPGIQDTSGNDMEEYTWSFRTLANPAQGSNHDIDREVMEKIKNADK